MESIGIIAEYNPFHNGHLYHLTESRKQSGLHPSVCVMSGNFTQRGDAAILDKWTRAGMAVNSGVDLVIELPAIFAIRSAQGFASGALRLLDALGIIHTLSFGAETANLAQLKQTASAAALPLSQRALREHLKTGMSYAAALEAAMRENGQITHLSLSEPNNILAIEYLKAITAYACLIEPLAVGRTTAPHHQKEITSAISSATAIRNQIMNEIPDTDALANALPQYSYGIIASLLPQKDQFASLHYANSAILAALRTIKLLELSHVPGISEGLEYKFADAALKGRSIEEILLQAKSKRYPMSRLKRILIHTLLRTTKSQIHAFDESGPLYARVLAFNHTGRLLLKKARQTSRIPIIMKTAAYLTSAARAKGDLSPLQEMLAIDTYATDLYALCYKEKKQGALDFLQSPIYVEK